MLDAPRAVCVSTGLGTEVYESWRLNCERWRLIYFGTSYATCFLSPFWRPEFRGGCSILGKSVHAFIRVMEYLVCRMDSTKDAVEMEDFWERFIVWHISCY